MYNNVHYYICHRKSIKDYTCNIIYLKLFLYCENEQDIEIFGANLV